MIKDTIQIGLAIQEILSTNDALTDLIGEDKVFPVVAAEGTTFPFVLYAQTSLDCVGTKDGIHDEVAIVDINVLSDKYAECVQVASAVRTALEGFRGTAGEYEIDDISLNDASEQYVDAYYVKDLTFAITVEW